MPRHLPFVLKSRSFSFFLGDALFFSFLRRLVSPDTASFLPISREASIAQKHRFFGVSLLFLRDEARSLLRLCFGVQGGCLWCSRRLLRLFFKSMMVFPLLRDFSSVSEISFFSSGMHASAPLFGLVLGPVLFSEVFPSSPEGVAGP